MTWGDWAPVVWWFGACGLWYALSSPSRREVECDGCGRRLRPSEATFGADGRDGVLCERCARGGDAA